MFGEYVSIPIHPRMTEDSIQYVIDSIRELA
jgi:dTDP-4-amino-4,6-dideoxygalactose transaminase